MTDQINPDSRKPTHHAKLSDGQRTLKFNFVTPQRDGTVIKDPYNIRQFPLAQQAVKMTSGSNKYSDAEWPYTPIAQDDWSGGRGAKTFELDQSRYSDGYMVNTEKENEVVLGGEPMYFHFDGNHPTYAVMQEDIETFGGRQHDISKEFELYGTQRYVADTFITLVSQNFWLTEIWLRKVGNPGNLTIAIYSDNSGVPNALLEADSATIVDPSNFTDVLSRLVKAAFPTYVVLATGNTYWLVVYGASTDNADNHWNLLAKDSPTNGKKSSNGSTWVTGDINIPFRVKTYEFPMKTLMFEYKKATYLVTQPDDGSQSKLFINGDRGVADPNTGDKQYLNDASKTWKEGQWHGCWAKITNGPGSKEPNPYRYIAYNDATKLYCEPDWVVEHTTDTEYVILGSNYWTYVTALTYYCTDVAVQGEWVYFARSETYQVLRWWGYNGAGTWTHATASEPYYAEKLLLIRNVDTGNFELYGSENHHIFYHSAVWKANVPPFWGNLYGEIGILAEVNVPWDNVGTTGITDVSHWCNYVGNGHVIASGFTTGVFAMYKLPQALDISGGDRLVFGMWTNRSGGIADNVVRVRLTDADTVTAASFTTAGDYDEFNVGVLNENVYTWISLDISPQQLSSNINYSKISGIALYTNVDLGASSVNIALQFPVVVTRQIQEYIALPPWEYVQALTAYSGDVNDPRDNPWVITEDGVYEIQTQNGNKLVPLPIGEIKAMASENTGRARGVNDVYLYFSLGDDKLQRYYSRNLDDIGPDRDDGLPTNRRGKPSAVLSLPGRVIVAIDAGEDGYSSVLALNGQAYCEIYRSPRTNARIRGLHYQVLPGTNVGRLLINETSDMLWVPVAFDPTKVDNENFPRRGYSFFHEGCLESTWIYGGMQSLIKIWRSLKLFLEEVAASDQFLQVDYRLDSDTAWTAIDGDFDVSPMDEYEFTASKPPNVKSRRIKLRLRFHTYDHLKSPRLLAMVIEAFSVATVRYGYSFDTLLSEDYMFTDLEGTEDMALGYSERVEDAHDLLKEWASSGTPLILDCVYSPFHNKTVVLDPPSDQPIDWRKNENQEEHILHVTVNEI